MKTPQPPAEEAQTKIENRSGLIDESVIARYIDMLFGDYDFEVGQCINFRFLGDARLPRSNMPIWIIPLAPGSSCSP